MSLGDQFIFKGIQRDGDEGVAFQMIFVDVQRALDG
jgi:hypothetical protein